MYVVKHKTKSGYLHDGLADNDGKGTGWVAEAATAAAVILDLALGKKPESESDIAKQQIQQQLAQAGYTQFNMMESWKGDEDRKMQAMATIYSTIQQYPNSVSQMEAWLENGQITPNMISKVRSKYPLQRSTNNYSSLLNLGNDGDDNNEAGLNNNILIYGSIALAGVVILASAMGNKGGKK